MLSVQLVSNMNMLGSGLCLVGKGSGRRRGVGGRGITGRWKGVGGREEMQRSVHVHVKNTGGVCILWSYFGDFNGTRWILSVFCVCSLYFLLLLRSISLSFS